MGANKYHIKRVDGFEEADLLMKMQETCFGYVYSKPKEPEEKSDWWIAYLDHDPAAFAAIRPSAQYPNCGYLSSAGVLPAHRGNGLQRKLIQIRIRWARKMGWTSLVSDTNDNPHSSNNLIECGFRMFRPQNPWSYKTSSYWRKELAA